MAIGFYSRLSGNDVQSYDTNLEMFDFFTYECVCVCVCQLVCVNVCVGACINLFV